MLSITCLAATAGATNGDRSGGQAMHTFKQSILGLAVVMPAMALAPAQAGASQVLDCASSLTCLSDSSEPGSIIVYQKFQRGFVTIDANAPGQSIQPRTLIKLGAVCPIDDNNFT